MKKRINNFVYYDRKYIAPGYFIIMEEDSNIRKFMKIFQNNFGLTNEYAIRAYEKDAVDLLSEDFREITFEVDAKDPAYNPIFTMSKYLDGDQLESGFPKMQGQSFMTADDEDNQAILTVAKDIQLSIDDSPLISIEFGQTLSPDQYCGIEQFYKQLGLVSKNKTVPGPTLSKIQTMTINARK